MAITWRRTPHQAVRPGPDGTTYPIPDPTKPSALLVPPFVLDRVAEARTRRRATLVAACAVVLAALASTGTWALAWSAEKDLRVLTEAKSVADARVAKYVEVARYYDGLTARRSALTAELAGDVRFSDVTEELFASAPAGVYLLNVEYAPDAPCPGPNPFVAEVALGCINIAGRAESAQAVGSYVDRLNAHVEKGLLGGAFASALAERSAGADISFNISVNYGVDALSYRFVDQPTDATTGIPADATTDSEVTP